MLCDKGHEAGAVLALDRSSELADYVVLRPLQTYDLIEVSGRWHKVSHFVISLVTGISIGPTMLGRAGYDLVNRGPWCSNPSARAGDPKKGTQLAGRSESQSISVTPRRGNYR